MARFLNDEELGAAIRKVMKGENVRCAVAFWGDGARKALFISKGNASRARIICDLTMGGTNPAELEQLGAPNNTNLKHVKGLHAKVYLSDLGLVVASANASNRGIGFVEVAALTECGTLHKPGTKAFHDAEEWFELLWKKSHDVNIEALDDAKRAWARRPRHGAPAVDGLSASPASLLRRIASNPDTYRGVGVVFTSGEAEDGDVEEASDTAIAADDTLSEPLLSAGDRARLREWPSEHLFTGWSDAEASAWPKTFLCAHRGKRGAVSYWCYEQFTDARVDQDDWSVFAAPSKALQARLGISTAARKAAKLEDELLGKIFKHLDSHLEAIDGIGHRLCETPAQLAALLDNIGD